MLEGEVDAKAELGSALLVVEDGAHCDGQDRRNRHFPQCRHRALGRHLRTTNIS